MRWSRLIPLLLLFTVVASSCVEVVISIPDWQRAPEQNQIVITVPVIITATPDPNQVRQTPWIITSTPQVGACILYVIQNGDTLFGIAEQFGIDGFELMAVNGLNEETVAFLQVGQTLIVPLAGCELPALSRGSTVTVTPPAAIEGSGQIAILRVMGAGDITTEGIEIQNNGAVLDLSGWTLNDGGQNTYTFTDQRFFTNGRLVVYTRTGDDTPSAKYWDRQAPVWISGTTVVLRDQAGNVQSTFVVP